MVLPPSFAPKERKKREQERRRAAELLKDEQQQGIAATRAKEIARKALEEKAKTGRLTSADFDEAREQAQQLANEIYGKMKEAEKAKEAARRLTPPSKQSKRREVSLKPSERISKSNPAESVSEAIGKKLRKKQETRHKPREESKPKDSRKSTSRPKEKTKPKSAATKERIKVQRRAPDETHKPLKERNKVGRVHDVKMSSSEIRGVKFQTGNELRKYVKTELNGMKHLPGFDKMMSDAIAHIKLKKLIGDRKSLTFPEIRELSNQIDVPLRTTRKWVTDSGNPKLYKLADSAITKSEAKTILSKLKISRNGVDSVPEIEKRLANLYTGENVRELKSFNRDLDASAKYYKFLELMSEGGVVTDIARRAGVSPLTGRNCTNGIFPHLVKRVVDVPSTMPKDGWKWLPAEINGTHRITEVPLKPKDWSDVQQVLQQFGVVGDKMAQLSSRFDIHDVESAFMYALGVIISDGSLSTSGLSSRMTLPLSKKYNWTPTFGEAVCLCLGALGVKAEKKSDWSSPDNIITDGEKKRRISGPGFHVWGSEHHPLLRWTRESCLGLKTHQNKIENPIDVEWALSAPRRKRIALLRGIADGDGYVSVNSQYAALSTKVNQPFFGRLLRSFDIESLETKKDVLVKQTESILRFAKLEPFKQAKSRRDDFEELNSLVIARKSKAVGSRISQGEIDHALDLRRKGKSYGEITKLVYREFGTSWDISTIEHAIKKRTQAKSSQS